MQQTSSQETDSQRCKKFRNFCGTKFTFKLILRDFVVYINLFQNDLYHTFPSCIFSLRYAFTLHSADVYIYQVVFSLEVVYLKLLLVFLILPHALQVALFNTLLGLYVLKYKWLQLTGMLSLDLSIFLRWTSRLLMSRDVILGRVTSATE